MKGRRDDAEEIRRRLGDQIESLLDHLYPGWAKRGGKAYLTPKNAKQLGSFQVNLTGARRGQWYRFSQDVGGGTVELISYAHTNGTHAYEIAFREARRFLGMDDQPRAEDDRLRQRREEERAAAAEKRKHAEAADAARRERKAETAADIWSHCRPIAGTAAEIYLTGRGVPAPPEGWPDVLGFHPGLEWDQGAEWSDGRKVRKGPVFPCLVGRVQDVAGDTTAIWRIYLAADGGKAPVTPAKLGLGAAKGGAIRIGGIGERIGVAEGLETALGAWWLIGRRYPVWSAMSTSGMAGIELPLAVNRVVIFPDGDKPTRRHGDEFVPTHGGAGIVAARRLAERMADARMPHVIEAEPPMGRDYLDLWNQISEHQ